MPFSRRFPSAIFLAGLILLAFPLAFGQTPPPPDFSLDTNLPELAVPLGETDSLEVIFSTTGGFGDQLDLSIDPATIPDDTSISLESVTVLNPYDPVTLTVSPMLSSPPGSHPITIIATNGTLIRSATFTLYISNFQMFSTPNSISVRQGETQDVTVTIQSQNRFSGTIALDIAPNLQGDGVTVTTNPSTVSVQQDASGSAVIRFVASETATIKSHTVTITGTLQFGNLQDLTAITVNVIPNPLFVNLQATPNPAIIFQESSLIATVTDTQGTPVSGTAVTLSATSGIGTFSNGDTTISGITDGSGRFITAFTPTTRAQVTIIVDAAKSGFASGSFVLALQVIGDFLILVDPQTSTINVGATSLISITVRSIDDFSAQVSLSTSPVVSGIGMVFISRTLTPPPDGEQETSLQISVSSSVEPRSYVFSVIGNSGSLTRTAQITVEVPAREFSLTIDPLSSSISQGESTTYNITITSSGGFSGNIQFDIPNLPGDLVASFSPNPVPVTAGSSRSLILTITTFLSTQPRNMMPLIIEATYSTGTVPVQAALTILELFEVLIDSSPRVSAISIDGTIYQPEELPKTFRWVQGEEHTVAIPQSIVDGSPGVRYVFESWGDGNTELSRTIIAGSATTFRADFSKQYLLRLSSQPFGVAEPIGGGWFEEGETATIRTDEILPLSERSRYLFDGWSGGITSSDPLISLVMNEVKTIAANYVIQYLVETVSNPEGLAQISNGGDWHVAGEEIELSVVGRIGDYAFSRWIFDGNTSEDNPVRIIVDGPLVITAHFVLLPKVGIIDLEVTESKTAFEGESTYAWVKVANTIERAGEIKLLTRNSDGVTVFPTSQIIFLGPGETRTVGFELRYAREGLVTFEVFIEETAGGPDTISAQLRVFSLEEKNRVRAIGMAIGAKFLPNIDLLMQPDQSVREFAERILVANSVSADSSKMQQAQAILDFVLSHSSLSEEILPQRDVVRMISELEATGGVEGTHLIEGDSTTFQILFGGLMRSLEIEARPVIGTMNSSPLLDEPFVLAHSWVEIKVEDWVHVDPMLGLLDGKGAALPENIDSLLTDPKFVYDLLPSWGGVLTAITYDGQLLDITQDYRMMATEQLTGYLLFVDGPVEINIISGEDVVASGIPFSFLWTPFDPQSTDVKTLAPVGQLILVEEGFEDGDISLIVEGQLGLDYRLNVLRLSTRTPILSSMESSLVTKTRAEHRITSSMSSGGPDRFLITQIQAVQFSPDQIIYLSSNSTILEERVEERIDALRLTLGGRQGTIGTINITFSKSLINQIDSSLDRILVVLDGKIASAEVIDMGLDVVIRMSYEHSEEIGTIEMSERVLLIYLKTYKLTVDIRDPFNQKIGRADLVVQGPLGNNTRVSEESTFTNLVPGEYEVTVRYRGESQRLTRLVSDRDLIVSVNLFRSDSTVALITTSVLAIVGSVAIGVQGGLSRIMEVGGRRAK